MWKIIMGFQMSCDFGVALTDFASYITGKRVCNSELSIICWRVVYVCDSWGGFGVPHLTSIFSNTYDEQPEEQLGLLPLSCRQIFWSLPSLLCLHGMSNIFCIFIPPFVFLLLACIPSCESWVWIVTVTLWHSPWNRFLMSPFTLLSIKAI